jgi:hypothetical protein
MRQLLLVPVEGLMGRLVARATDEVQQLSRGIAKPPQKTPTYYEMSLSYYPRAASTLAMLRPYAAHSRSEIPRLEEALKRRINHDGNKLESEVRHGVCRPVQ